MTPATQPQRNDEITAPLAGPAVIGRQPSGLLRRLSDIARCRKGSAAMMFAAASVGFLGLVGLATEAGGWYMSNRRGQNAVDAAAIAGVMTYSVFSDSDSSKTYAAVDDTSARNGFTAGSGITVSRYRPPRSPSPNAGNNSAVEVVITQAQAVSFSRLFNISAATIGNRAVAAITGAGNACVLALTGDLKLNGNLSIPARNCMLASNNTGATSININGSVTIDVQSLRASGGCTGCTTSGGHVVTLQTPYAAHATATVDPFSSLAGVTWPSYNGSACDNGKYGTGQSGGSASGPPLIPTYSPGGVTAKAYCGGLKMSNTDVFDMLPGTYVFYNADVSITGGTLTCSTCNDTNGVSIVQVGTNNQQGTININGGDVTLSAGMTQPCPPCAASTPSVPNALRGVVYYRQNVTSNGGGDPVRINGNTNTHLKGGVYFPGAGATYNGTGSSACTIIVGGTINMNGTAVLDQSGCSNIGTPYATSRTVALVE